MTMEKQLADAASEYAPGPTLKAHCNARYIVYGLGYVVMLWWLYITSLNGFSADDCIGLIAVLILVGLVFQTTEALILFQGTTVLLTSLLVLRVPEPGASTTLLMLTLICLSIISYVLRRYARRLEQALQESEERYRALFENQDEGIGILGPGGQFTLANRAAHDIFGVPQGTLVGRSLDLFCVEQSIPVGFGQDGSHRPEKKLIYEVDVERPSGDRRHLLVTATPRHDKAGRAAETFAMFRDVTEQRQVEERMRYLSFHDALTGLHNRAYFTEEMRRLDGGQSYPTTVVVLDVDGLKLVNDTLGHASGDELLRGCARILRECFRNGDVVARVGGDEFGVILPQTGGDAAKGICDRLERQLAAYSEEYPDLPLSVSFGTSTTYSSDVSLEVAFALADKSMYVEKLGRSASGTSGVVSALITALATKDYRSEGHVARVRDTARMLGRALGLTAQDLADIELLAEVHDLGKVGIPDEILQKKGSLDHEERQQMQKHSALGWRIAKSAPELSRVAELILHHHEWWNGQGYPSGLSGLQIPRACRILAIADAYDAMTHDRPYRAAMTSEASIAELRAKAGIQFDPIMVDIFCEFTL